jgi:predicted PurR-regulated permease PerM
LDVVAIDQLIRSQNISGQISQVATILGQQLLLFLTGVGSFLTQLLLSIILSIYITMEGRQLHDDFFKVLPKAAHETATAAITQITRAFEGYLRGALLAAAIEGTMCFMALTVFRVNYALPTAALYFVVNLVPLVGSPLGMITVFLVTLFANPAALLWVMVTLVCSNLINAYVITPRVMSGAVGVPSILALLSTTVGVQLFGFWGLIFGTPVTGAAYAFVMNFLVPRARGELVHESAEVSPVISPVSEPRPTSIPHSQIAHSSKS